MTTYIALLRAINVGGHRKIKMADLSTVFAEAGAEHVKTYIQSGNVVFHHAARSADKLRSELEGRIAEAAGFEVPVSLRTAPEWEAVIRDNPFAHVDPAHLHVAFLREKPNPGAVSSLDAVAFAPEELAVRGREVYLHLPNGVGRSKLPQALDVLETPATVRNWRTVLKLQEMAG